MLMVVERKICPERFQKHILYTLTFLIHSLLLTRLSLFLDVYKFITMRCILQSPGIMIKKLHFINFRRK